MIGTHTITLGDTLEPLKALLVNGNGDPYDLANYTVTVGMEEEGGTEELAFTSTGVTKHPTQVFTVDTSLDTLKCNAHGAQNGDQVVLASATTIPGGLAVATRYFVVERDANSFKVASRSGGPAIDITSAGSGEHTFYIVGSVQHDFAAANVDAAKTIRLWFRLDSGSEYKTLPEGNRWFRVDVVAKGA